MSRPTALAVILPALLLATISVPALAQSDPIGGCPDGFHLHRIGDNHDGHAHFHVGTAADQNDDGWICAKHVSFDESIHVHIDNAVEPE